jgi:YgiT-type zinc finger domain-containing protein
MSKIDAIRVFLNPVNLTMGVLIALATYKILKKLFNIFNRRKLKSVCPICGKGILHRCVGDETFHYKGEPVIISGYVGYTCTVCGETIANGETIKRSGKILKEFKNKINGVKG